ncbi:O-antigen ligase family protein [Sphingomonas sp. RB3P16]|uniref:O-antigen ligase family protein n=1 Tax=Parasphingomonas frigoris TaxID=3096163 RepID=UPI002FC6C46D
MTDSVLRRTSPLGAPRGQLPGRTAQVRLGQLEVMLGVVAVLAVAVTLVAGTIGAAIFLVATVALIGVRPAASARDLARFAPLLALPLLAMVSTIWSDAPERTLRAGIQLMVTIMAAIIVCRRVPSTTLIAVLLAATLAMCLGSLAKLPAALSSGHPLVGLFGSKNELALVAHLQFALDLAIIFDRRQHPLLRIGALLAVPLAVLLVILAQSAGVKTSLIVTLLTFPAFLLIGRVSPALRIVIIVLTAVALALALVFMSDILAAWTDYQVNVLKKDTTLTGRTYLWDFAARLVAERPLLGHGYYAFWRVGNVDAEGLWRWGGIASRSGFNFHNELVEMKVDLGWVGAIVFLVTSAGIAAATLLRQFTKGDVIIAALMSLLTVLYIRSLAESSLIGPFNIMTFLWIGAAVYARTESKPLRDKSSIPQTHQGRAARQFPARVP